MIYVLGCLVFFVIVGNISVQIMMANYLRKRGYSVNIWLIRSLILKYLRQYREVTIKECGKTGPLFFIFIASVTVLIPLLVILLILPAI